LGTTWLPLGQSKAPKTGSCSARNAINLGAWQPNQQCLLLAARHNAR
jgi:hypothetical protein